MNTRNQTAPNEPAVMGEAGPFQKLGAKSKKKKGNLLSASFMLMTC